MKTRISHPKPRRGFTLTELLVATGLASVVLSSFVAAFLQQRKTFHHKNLEQEMQQNVRTAMMFLQRDLRYAGSGVVMGFLNLNNWFDVPAGMNQIPWIINGGDNSDQLLLIGISGEAVAELADHVIEGDTRMDLVIRDPAILPYSPLEGDVLVLAGIESVVVNEILSPTRIRVSRDPGVSNVGVHLIYPAGTEIFQLNVVRYRVGTVENVPSLLREDSRYSYGSDEDRVVADGIERFKVSRSGNLVEITLTGRSRRTVPGVGSADSLLRYTMNSTNRLRNTSPRLSIQGWPSDILLGNTELDAEIRRRWQGQN